MTDFHAMDTGELAALFRQGTAPPRMGQLWQYLEFRRRLRASILDAATEIDLLGIHGTPAEGRILQEMQGKGAVFDDPDITHLPWVCPPNGYARISK